MATVTHDIFFVRTSCHLKQAGTNLRDDFEKFYAYSKNIVPLNLDTTLRL